MKAARLRGFGKAAEVLSVESLELPAPADGEIQVEMLAAPINPADLNVIEGTYGQLPTPPAIIGNEGVGRVAHLGHGVSQLRTGDLVALLDPGSWCSHRNVQASRVIPVPADIDPQQAAMLVVNPPTAHAMLHDFVSLQPGDWIVQNAANSGVGRCVIQLARHLGLRTLNLVRRTGLIDELLALGADRVVMEDTDLRKDGVAARLALNAVGGASALNVANALAPGGTHVTYGAMSRQPLKLPNGLLIFKNLAFRGFWLREWFQQTPMSKQQAVFRELAEAMAAGALSMPVDSVHPLERIHEALDAAAKEHRGGKVLLDLRA